MTVVDSITVTADRFTAEITDTLITVTTPDGPHDAPSRVLAIPAKDAATLIMLLNTGMDTLAQLQRSEL